MNTVAPRASCGHLRSELCDCPDRLLTLDCGCVDCSSASVLYGRRRKTCAVPQRLVAELTTEQRTRLCHGKGTAEQVLQGEREAEAWQVPDWLDVEGR